MLAEGRNAVGRTGASVTESEAMPIAKGSRRRLGILLALTVLSWVAFAAVQLRVPAYKRQFDEYALSLPEITRTAIRFNNLSPEFWLLATLQAIGLLLIAVVLYHFARSPSLRRWVVRFWIVFLILLPTAITIFSFMVIQLAALKLDRALHEARANNRSIQANCDLY
jgi:type II secretory pathway component PulF